MTGEPCGCRAGKALAHLAAAPSADETTKECACGECDTVTWCSREPLYVGSYVVSHIWLCNACVVKRAQERKQSAQQTMQAHEWDEDHLMSGFFVLANHELARARKKHGPMHSHHEAYAVLLEELDEVWGEVKSQKPDAQRIIAELIQVAAMCARWAEDVCSESGALPPTDERGR